ncbi:MAG: ABC transporter ATP-binding protein [Cyanobacterium sp. T60_A2020_053]|nr:ABC transporter ATP-binding protein [Cyanobacterium sp. T60_A2020_053]
MAVILKNVSKIYNQIPVVNDLSFEIKSGEIFGLLGPNGAGKSTTIKMLITLASASSGIIEVAGYDVSKNPEQVKRSIGVVLQQTSVDGELTVWENLEFHGRMHHIPNPERQELINRWLEYVELSDRRRDLVKTLSGGMKRRLQIARALLHNPQVLFLDEPTVGLDPQTRRRLWEIIKDLNRQGMTILLTTHYMEEVEFLCQRVGIIDAGQLIELGTVEQFKEKYGQGIMVKQKGERIDYEFFPTLQDANEYVNHLQDRTGIMIRASNLEDIFVKLTGHQL